MFHDGAKVLARDCVASIRRWGVRDPFGQALMQRTDELSAPDDRTIVFRLNKAFILLPDALGKFSANMCAIMPERLASTDPSKQITEAIGSGPFRFKADERVQGSLLVYERFAAYKPREDGEADFLSGSKVAQFDRVEWNIIGDLATVAGALRSGEIDWQEFPHIDQVPQFRRDRGITVERAGSTGWGNMLRPNQLLPPFDNAAVRRALMGAIDQTQFVIAAEGTDPTMWRVPAGYFPPGSPLASDAGLAALTSPRNLTKVKQEIEAAGYRGEKIVLIVTPEAWTMKLFSDVAADMLQKVGMNVDYQAMEYGTLVQRRNNKKPPDQGGWNLLVTALQGMDLLSPANNYLLRGNGERGAFGWPSSPKLEALRDAWFDAPDLATQKSICAQLQAQAFVDVPYWPLGAFYVLTAYRSDLTGTLDGQSLFWNLRREG
jgi:peptide/nickel transport system substrate-binding protein